MSDDYAFKGLQAFFVAFLDLDLYAKGIAWSKRGDIVALQLLRKLRHNR